MNRQRRHLRPASYGKQRRWRSAKGRQSLLGKMKSARLKEIDFAYLELAGASQHTAATGPQQDMRRTARATGLFLVRARRELRQTKMSDARSAVWSDASAARCASNGNASPRSPVRSLTVKGFSHQQCRKLVLVAGDYDSLVSRKRPDPCVVV